MKNFKTKSTWLFQLAKPCIPLIILLILIGSVNAVITVSMALVSKSLIDAATSLQRALIVQSILAMAGIILLQIILLTGSSILITHCNTKLSQSIQARLYDHILRSQWTATSSYHSGNLLTRLTTDVNVVVTLFTDAIPNILGLCVMLITAFISLLFLEPTMAIIAIVISPLFLLISKVFAKHFKHIYLAAQNEEATYRSFIQETLQNTLLVKSFCQEDTHLHKLQTIQRTKAGLAIKRSWVSAGSSSALQISSWLGYFLVYCWGAFKLADGIGTFGTLTALLQLFGNIRGPFSGLAHYLPQVISAWASADRLMEIDQLPAEAPAKALLEAPRALHQAPTIHFNQVDFAYHPQSPILKGITLSIQPGETIGIIGTSGEGKTTLLRLLLSLIQPTHGSISMTIGKQQTPLHIGHRQLFAYVPQGNTLFSHTIGENLLYGHPDATPLEIQEAISLGCADFIYDLDHQLDTQLGEKGLGLSEGQAQRISLSRALLSQRPILILDEATSALDGETELSVLASLKALPHKPTCILITHRPSALAICDRVFKLSKGHLEDVSEYEQAANL